MCDRICVVLLAVAASWAAWTAANVSTSGPAASGPTADDVRKAVERLQSAEPTALIAAAEVIAQSDDASAWQALRETLVDPDRLRHLEARTRQPGTEGLRYDLMYGHFARILRVIAEGSPPCAAQTLMWLAEQPLYAGTYRTQAKDEASWRAYLTYDSFQHLHGPPTRDLLGFYRKKVTSETFHSDLKNRIMEALAAHGDVKSVQLFEEHLWGVAGRILLVKHRDNYECTRLLLNIFRDATNAKSAHRILDQLLFQETYAAGLFEKPVTLPRIKPEGEEADKFAVLFKGFLADSGKIPLTKKEVDAIKALIAKIENGTATQPSSSDGWRGQRR